MDILLRKNEENKMIYACDPDSGEYLTRISPTIYCDADNLGSEYDHASGIYWKSFAEAKRRIRINFINSIGKKRYFHKIIKE